MEDSLELPACVTAVAARQLNHHHHNHDTHQNRQTPAHPSLDSHAGPESGSPISALDGCPRTKEKINEEPGVIKGKCAVVCAQRDRDGYGNEGSNDEEDKGKRGNYGGVESFQSSRRSSAPHFKPRRLWGTYSAVSPHPSQTRDRRLPVINFNVNDSGGCRTKPSSSNDTIITNTPSGPLLVPALIPQYQLHPQPSYLHQNSSGFHPNPQERIRTNAIMYSQPPSYSPFHPLHPPYPYTSDQQKYFYGFTPIENPYNYPVNDNPNHRNQNWHQTQHQRQQHQQQGQSRLGIMSSSSTSPIPPMTEQISWQDKLKGMNLNK
jgi:hypothetical protein